MSAIRSQAGVLFVVIALIGAAATVSLIPSPSSEHVLRDIDGIAHGSLEHPEASKWTLLFFLVSDCPIANQYAPEIQRICAKYGPHGAKCFLVYADPSMKIDAIRKHMKDFRHDTCCTAILDSNHSLVKLSGAAVSAEVAIYSSGARLQYRGRINNFYAALGTPRQRATQNDLRDALDQLVAGHKVENPRTEALGCSIPEIDSED